VCLHTLLTDPGEHLSVVNGHGMEAKELPRLHLKY
jgi:hypothetical protein